MGSYERPSLGFRIIREGAEQVHGSAEVNQMSPPDSPGNKTLFYPEAAQVSTVKRPSSILLFQLVLSVSVTVAEQ